jgi:hypothetical protein
MNQRQKDEICGQWSDTKMSRGRDMLKVYCFFQSNHKDCEQLPKEQPGPTTCKKPG